MRVSVPHATCQPLASIISLWKKAEHSGHCTLGWESPAGPGAADAVGVPARPGGAAAEGPGRAGGEARRSSSEEELTLAARLTGGRLGRSAGF